MNITKDTVVTLSYTVTETTGQVVGRTEPNQPVTALIGHGFLIKGLEKALEGHKKGDEFGITLTPEESYGQIDKNLIQVIDRSMFGDFKLEVGNVFEADSNQGPVAVVVKEITDTTVTVDGNHPLAGKTLNFLIVIEDVREATEEEIKHGHAHVNGHCPSHEHEHGHCCCHHHHDHDEGEDHKCCDKHHHEDGEEHKCCGKHHHEDGEEHKCCGKHHHHDDEDGHKCCGKHHHAE